MKFKIILKKEIIEELEIEIFAASKSQATKEFKKMIKGVEFEDYLRFFNEQVFREEKPILKKVAYSFNYKNLKPDNPGRR